MAKTEIWRKVKDYHDEVCEICDEKVDYCSCWRCMDCEELFAEDEGDGTVVNDDGETICVDCASSLYERWVLRD